MGMASSELSSSLSRPAAHRCILCQRHLRPSFQYCRVSWPGTLSFALNPLNALNSLWSFFSARNVQFLGIKVLPTDGVFWCWSSNPCQNYCNTMNRMFCDLVVQVILRFSEVMSNLVKDFFNIDLCHLQQLASEKDVLDQSRVRGERWCCHWHALPLVRSSLMPLRLGCRKRSTLTLLATLYIGKFEMAQETRTSKAFCIKPSVLAAM